MKIYSVRFKNWLVFKDFYKIFKDKSIIGIIAQHADNPDASNEVGKTAMIEGIIYTLTGHSRADTETELIHYGADELINEVVLIDGDKKYKIVRRRTSDNIGSVELTGLEGSKKKEAQKAIDELIGYVKDELLMTSYMEQGSVNAFMQLKPAPMQAKMMSWMENNYWGDFAKATSKKISSADFAILKLKTKIEVLSEGKKRIEKISAYIKNGKDALEYIKLRINKKKTLLKEKQSKIEKLDKLQATKQEVSLTKDKISHYEKKLKSSVHNNAEVTKLKNEKTSLVKGKIERPSSNESAKIIVLVSDLKNKIQAAKNKCGTCPILKEECDRITVKPSELSDLKRQLKSAENKEIKLNAKEDKHEEWLESYERLLSRLAHAQSLTFNTEAIRKDLSVSKTNLKVLLGRVESFDQEKYDKLHKKCLELDSSIENLEEGKSKLLTSIGEFTAQRKEQKQRSKKIKIYKEKIVKKEKRLNHLKYLAYMFGKRGIPSLEIENGFSEISDEMNYVLDKLQTSFQVQFQAQREINEWEPECLNCARKYPKGTRKHICSNCNIPRAKKQKEEFKIKVLQGEIENGFNMESGAGKALFSVALRVALALLKRRQKGARFSVLFLDEPDAPFDKVKKAAFIKLVTNTLHKELGFEQIFWISHSSDIQGLIPDILQITKGKKRSTAKWLT